MNTNAPGHSFIVRLIQNFLTKLSQHPEFYNTRYYKKMHRNNRHGHIVW